MPFIIADCAGLHDTQDPVETIGMGKTTDYLRKSDLILFMIDADDPFTAEDQNIYKIINNKRAMLVVNKIDLVQDPLDMKLPESWGKMPVCKISALYGNGVNALKDMIVQLTLGDHRFEVKDTVIPNLRHKNALLKSLELLISAKNEMRKGTSFELIAIDVREAQDRLGEIIGATAKEDVVDHIFSRFCIGK